METEEFLLSHGYSQCEANAEIKFIKEVGNDLVIFEYRYGDDKKGWVYITE